jgi:hypothetical protein
MAKLLLLLGYFLLYVTEDALGNLDAIGMLLVDLGQNIHCSRVEPCLDKPARSFWEEDNNSKL